MGRVQRAMCSGILGLQAMALVPFTPVLLSLTDVGTGPAIAIGVGLILACLVAAGTMRTPVGGLLGWLVEVATIAFGLVVPVMYGLGAVFLALYGGSWVLGAKIDRERAEREAAAA
ncbi:DUF4233 domain-containing protein [Nocardioides caldifontis]|uniref:DUF4233 domain-containing protein n=1 Tax=Nocardioides caldifontis TaxID=2588938 RepID=UPI0011DFD89E|nr:DUF4233 domain-containing protein [Nocardioides caldifontis]